jgi:RNA polymerase sigma-70 factor, ECF subfamily
VTSWRGHDPWSVQASLPQAADDAALVRRARAGDGRAFALLYGRYERRLLALCRRLLGDWCLAEDVAQQAAVEALVGLPRLAAPERFGAWLLAIGANLCRHHLRSPLRRLVSFEASLASRAVGEPPALDPEPAHMVEVGELAATVRIAVSELPPGQRRAAELFYLGGLSLAETAVALGINVGAAKARLHKGRLALRRRLLTEGF